jgi:hypothetical protein
MSQQLNIEREPVCWANEAPNTRSRPGFKWARNAAGEVVRVPSLDASGQQLIERIPQGAQFGTPMTGLQSAPIRSSARVLRHDGVITDVRINNGAAHDATSLGDLSYEQYMLGTKGRALGWIPMGMCPAAMAVTVDSRGRETLPSSTIAAPAVVRDGHPCQARDVGRRNPPCRHFMAEWEARVAANKARHLRDIEAFKSDEAKLLEGQAKLQAQQSDVLTNAVSTMAAAVSALHARSPEVVPPEASLPPAKDAKK